MKPSKKPSLTAALQQATGKNMLPVVVANEAVPPPTSSELPPSRRGKKIISGYFDPAVARQLKQLALDHDMTVQTLLNEALNDLFVKHNRQPLA